MFTFLRKVSFRKSPSIYAKGNVRCLSREKRLSPVEYNLKELTVSELFVNPKDLDAAASNAEKAHQSAKSVKLSTSVNDVSDAMPGGSSGKAALGAGNYIDQAAGRLSGALEAFSQSISDSKSTYDRTDHSVSVEFSRVDSQLSGGEK